MGVTQTKPTESAPLRTSSSIQRASRQLVAFPELVPLVLLIITSVCFAIASSAFMSASNISNMWAFIPELGIMALAMTMLLTAGEFDLSVGAVFAFGPLLSFILSEQAGLPVALGILIGLAASVLVGLVNGFLVTKVGISSFLVTLGTMLTIRGLSLFISDGFPEDTNSVEGFMRSVLVGRVTVGSFVFYASIVWFLGLAIVLHLVLNESRFGNAVMATGGNKRSAAARGIKTDWVKIRLFVMASFLACVAGLISSVRIGSASPIAGQGYELEVIAMAVVGGTSLFGGRGTVIGTVIGTVLLRSIRNGIVIVGFAGLAYDMFVGLIILIAMSVQAYIQRQGAR
jgi:simple sugar transport system permease protein